MARLVYQGGPWHGTWERYPNIIPSVLIPVYAAPDTALVCADEQVTKLLGKYRRSVGSESPNYTYVWESTEVL